MSSDLPGDPPAPGDMPPQPTPDPAVEAPAPVVEPTPPAPDPDPVVAEPDVNPPAMTEFEPGAPAAPPAAVLATGKVVEVREEFILLRSGVDPTEHIYPVNAGHGALPGHAVTIYDDGSVDLGNYAAPDPVIEIPSKPVVE